MAATFTKRTALAGIVALSSLFIAYDAGVAGITAFLASKRPQLAMRLNPENGAAVGRGVQHAVAAAGGKRKVSRPEQAALVGALKHDPLSRVALRMLALGVEGEGQKNRARQIMTLSSQVSRRDVGTQIWLIGDAAARGDIVKTIAHYDAALSSRASSSQILFPLLTKGLSYDPLHPVLAPYLRDRPWAEGFIAYATNSNQQAAKLGHLLELAGSFPKDPHTRVILGQVVAKFAAEGDAKGGERFAIRMMGVKPQIFADFGLHKSTTDATLAPLSWAIPNPGGVVGELSKDGGVDLFVPSDNRGVVLSRVVSMSPGRYRLLQSISYPEGGAPLSLGWEATCIAGKKATKFWGQDLPRSTNAARYTAELVVGDGCGTVRFDLIVRGDDRREPAVATISGLELRKS